MVVITALVLKPLAMQSSNGSISKHLQARFLLCVYERVMNHEIWNALVLSQGIAPCHRYRNEGLMIINPFLTKMLMLSSGHTDAHTRCSDST